MLDIKQLSIDHQDLYLPAVTDSRAPVFRWKLVSDVPGDTQRSYRMIVRSENEIFWDTGTVNSKACEAAYGGRPLPSLETLFAELYVTARSGDDAWTEKSFATYTDGFDFPWIASANDEPRRVVRFLKTVTVDTRKALKSAFAIYCGIGYCTLFVNGRRTNPDIALDPAFSDYTKTCYYVIDDVYYSAEDSRQLKLAFEVADGWRAFDSPYLKEMGVARPVFAGGNMLSAAIVIEYTDGTREVTVTDETWRWTYSNTVTASIYDGTVYDAGAAIRGRRPVRLCGAPGGEMKLMNIPPVMKQEKLSPVEVTNAGDGEWILDFGRNVAGVLSVEIPSYLEPGSEIVLRHSEELTEDGRLFTDTLRSALAEDRYITGEPSPSPVFWSPDYTYHGFRYASVKGYGGPIPDNAIKAVVLCTAVEQVGDFSCGSPVLNAIHAANVATEKANVHSILTDCPQRDERMGWMNDATVRFGTFPYNFEINRIFPKILRDISDAQGEDGALTCTAPFIIGSRPADPVCSAFLVAGYEYYMRSGDKATLREYFPRFKAWEECLLRHSEDYIVNYSYYGDWAGPVSSCMSDEDARSKDTPGILMSTGYSYYNCRLLAFFARELRLYKEASRYEELSDRIKDAFLRRWFTEKPLAVAGNSQGSIAFALYLGIIPEKHRAGLAELLNRLVIENGFKLSCGNLTSRYILEVLSDYGFADTVYSVMTDDAYPGIGYMLQNEATTVWERFELKKNPSMNSHNHPMYAACDIWFYKYLLGITNVKPGFSECVIAPVMPGKLLSARGSVETPFGRLSVRWAKRYGKTVITVTVPFGMKATLRAGGLEKALTGGSWTVSFECQG